MITQCHTASNNVMSFLQTRDLPAATFSKMSDILSNGGHCRKLKIELAITIYRFYGYICPKKYNLRVMVHYL